MSPDLPWFPFWASDFISSRKVRTMTPEQVGIYILLLCHQWTDGPLPDDDESLSALANGAPKKECRTVVERSFSNRSEGWVNERLESVRNEQDRRAKRLSEAGRAGGRASAKSRGSKKKERSFNGRSTMVEATVNQSESDSKRKRLKRKSAFPNDWHPQEAHRKRAAELGLDAEDQAAAFRDHHLANGSTFADWDRAFFTWLRKAKEFRREKKQYIGGGDGLGGTKPMRMY